MKGVYRGYAMVVARPVEVLLVEDSESDVALIREGMYEWSHNVHLTVATDGEDALLFLRKEGKNASAPTPSLIILDLNLPKKNGVDVLREIKGDPQLAQIPVLVLTTSDSEREVREAYRLHANCYLRKPLDIDEFFAQIKAIEEFWVEHARLPGRTVDNGPPFAR